MNQVSSDELLGAELASDCFSATLQTRRWGCPPRLEASGLHKQTLSLCFCVHFPLPSRDESAATTWSRSAASSFSQPVLLGPDSALRTGQGHSRSCNDEPFYLVYASNEKTSLLLAWEYERGKSCRGRCTSTAQLQVTGCQQTSPQSLNGSVLEDG